jgi:hypothetical protein
VYSFDSLPEAREQIDALPAEALPYFAELLAFLELTPGAGKPYNEQNPDGAMRAQPFGPHGEGLAVYLVLERQRRVVMLVITWIG